MMMNGSQLESGSFQQDNFPIGLIIISFETKGDSFSLISINKFALKLFNISSSSSTILNDFIKATKAFKQYFFDMCSLKSLYDSLIHLKNSIDHSESQYSNFILNGEIISIKMKRSQTRIFITADDFTEEKKLIRKKLVASIRKNYLMTINHELKNYLCGLITTLEETKSTIDPKDFTTITATVLLIQKVIKLYTLFTKVSFDELKCLTLKLEENIDLYLIALKVHIKFKEIFLYKNIEMCSIGPLKKIIVKTDYVYMKNLTFVLFLYLYYKVSDNAVIKMEIEYPTLSSCQVTFSNENNHYSSLNVREVTFEDEVKMNEVQVKMSVMTVDILKYLLTEIGKLLNISIDFFHSPSCSKLHKMPKEVNNKKLLILGFNDIEINSKATYANADRDLFDLKEIKKKGSKSEFIQKHVTYSNPNYSVIEFPFEKKNTYDLHRECDQNAINNPKKSFQNVMTMTKSEKENQNTNVSSFNYLSMPNKYEKVISAFSKSKNDLTDNCNESNNNIDANMNNLLKSAKFKSNCLFPLLNVDFESEEEHGVDNEISLLNNESSNTGEDDIGVATNINHNTHQGNTTPQKYLRSKKGFNSLTVNHPFTTEETTTIYSGSIGQKISNMLSSEDDIKRIIEEISEERNEKEVESNCDCHNIVIVDDESAIARSMIRILHNQHYEADYCKDGKDCIEKMLSKLICSCSKRYYKLILLDVYMVDWGGIATCRKINELIVNKTIPQTMNVVFISGHKLKDLDLPDYNFIKGFYQKPVNKSTIIKILQQYYY